MTKSNITPNSIIPGSVTSNNNTAKTPSDINSTSTIKSAINPPIMGNTTTNIKLSNNVTIEANTNKNAKKDIVDLSQLDREVEQEKPKLIKNNTENYPQKKKDSTGYSVSGSNKIQIPTDLFQVTDNSSNNTNVWKTALDKHSTKANPETSSNEKTNDYVDKVINSTEKLTFSEAESSGNTTDKPLLTNQENKPLNVDSKQVVSTSITTDSNIAITPNKNSAGDNFNLFNSTTESIASETLNKPKLNKIQQKKPLTSEPIVLSDSFSDYSNVKSKIDISAPKQTLQRDTEKENELKSKYEQIQKENKEKLGEYRDMIVKMKKEKRSEQEQQDKVIIT